jgi:PAS domain S-box-containing protein
MERAEEDLDDLRRRLLEAEEALHAIRTGAVDALFVEEPDGPKVYTLSSADRLYRQMIEEMGEGALTLAADRTIYYANRRFAQLVGQPQERITGTSLAAFLEPDQADDLGALLDGTSSTCEVLLRSPDGEVPVKLSASRLEAGEGGEDGVVCLVVTDLRLERDRDNLRAAHERKDEFLATLAHELRNPLAPIALAANLLRLRAGDGASQEVMSGIDIIDRQVAHMVHLIDDLLDVSRISRGKISLRRSQLDLCEVTQAGIESVRHLGEQAGHRLEIELPGAPLVIDGDRVRLTQVVENLVGNAVKYTAPGGDIRVRVFRDGQRARLQVCDTGIGLSNDELARVFEMFWQAESVPASGATGLGLGLALTRRLVEMHGGTLHASSPGRGGGSTFEVALPLVSGPAAPAATVASPPRVAQRAVSILVVDDNEDSAQTLGKLLGALGYRVEVRHTGSGALEAERASRPEVVILDIGLPDIDGVEVGRRLRVTRPSGELLLVALSGYGRREDRARTTAAGFDHHFNKPLCLEEFQSALHAFTGRP